MKNRSIRPEMTRLSCSSEFAAFPERKPAESAVVAVTPGLIPRRDHFHVD
jgi:hypothetical protein